MDHQAQDLTRAAVRVRPARDTLQALRLLLPAVRYAVDGSDLQQLAEGCTLLEVVDGERVTGCVAVQIADGEAWVNAAADHGQHLGQALHALEAWARAHGARRLAFVTMRPGMVRRMLGSGYSIQRAELKKDL